MKGDMPIDIKKATTLWIEAGKMSGGSKNQVELTDELAQFFDSKALAAKSCDVRLPIGKTAPGRPAAHRGRRYGQWVDMWRFGLPTQRQGAPKYPGTVIRLDKVKSKNNYIYELTVTSPGSAVSKQWEADAKAKGTLSVTGGPHGRRYGYW
jgi:hypothetical protein